jgi:HEPN domain-containing protein
MGFQRDPSHWLRKLSPDEWIQAALAELRRAEERVKANDLTAGLAGCKRAAGMALNGALIVAPNESWGRSFVDHVAALSPREGTRGLRRARLEQASGSGHPAIAEPALG